MRTFDHERRTTAADLVRLWLWGEGLGPAPCLADAHRAFRAFCNDLPTVGVPSRRELADALLTPGLRLVLRGDYDAARTFERYRTLYGVGREEFVDDALRRGSRFELPADAGDPVVGR